MAIDSNNPALYHTDDPTDPPVALFLNVITPKAQKRNGKDVGDPRYDVTLSFSPTSPNYAAIRQLAIDLAREKWPGRQIGQEAATKDANGNPKQPTFSFPFASGDVEADRAKTRGKDLEVARGRVLVKAKSQYQPSLSLLTNGKVVELHDEAIKANAGKFYRGAKVGVSILLKAYEGTGVIPDGVSATLYATVALGGGERLGGQGRSSAEAFKGYAGTVSSVDPTAGLADDDEIPF